MLLTALLHKKLEPQLGSAWLASGVTKFADNYLLTDTAEAFRDLDRAELRFGKILDSLADQGTQIN